LQAGAVAQGVIGEGEDVVGLVVGEVEREQVEAAVDGVDEADLVCQGVQGSNAAAAEAAGAVGDLVVDVPGSEHRTLAVEDVGFAEAAGDAALAVGQLLAYLSFHSKSLWAWTGDMACTTMKPQKSPGDFDFFRILARRETETSLV
jgi:hypothetical protein